MNTGASSYKKKARTRADQNWGKALRRKELGTPCEAPNTKARWFSNNLQLLYF
jgi:hypothetical protein